MYLIYVELCIIFFMTGLFHLLYIPTSSAQGLQFLINPTFVFWFFDSGHTNGYEVVSHCGFDLRFPND